MNFPSIAALAAVALASALAVRSLLKDKRSGCCGDCSRCRSSRGNTRR